METWKRADIKSGEISRLEGICCIYAGEVRIRTSQFDMSSYVRCREKHHSLLLHFGVSSSTSSDLATLRGFFHVVPGTDAICG